MKLIFVEICQIVSQKDYLKLLKIKANKLLIKKLKNLFFGGWCKLVKLTVHLFFVTIIFYYSMELLIVIINFIVCIVY